MCVHNIEKFSDLADDPLVNCKRGPVELAQANCGHISCGDKISLSLPGVRCQPLDNFIVKRLRVAV